MVPCPPNLPFGFLSFIPGLENIYNKELLKTVPKQHINLPFTFIFRENVRESGR